ncbi:MAG: hypothetical protein ACE5EF_07535, partial [Dehalococcoidia bacterium]
GGKTAVLAWSVGPGGRVAAADAARGRLGRLRDNCARIGAPAWILAMDAANPAFGAEFDLVLADAPCSASAICSKACSGVSWVDPDGGPFPSAQTTIGSSSQDRATRNSTERSKSGGSDRRISRDPPADVGSTPRPATAWAARRAARRSSLPSPVASILSLINATRR